MPVGCQGLYLDHLRGTAAAFLLPQFSILFGVPLSPYVNVADVAFGNVIVPRSEPTEEEELLGGKSPILITKKSCLLLD